MLQLLVSFCGKYQPYIRHPWLQEMLAWRGGGAGGTWTTTPAWWLCHIKKVQFSWTFSGFSANLTFGSLLVFVHSVLLLSVNKKKGQCLWGTQKSVFCPPPLPPINKVIKLKYLAFSRKRSFTRKCSVSCFHHSAPPALDHWEFGWPQ